MNERHELAGPPELFEFKREWQIEFLKEHGLRPNHKLLDIGCGVLRGGIPIIDYLSTYNYYGIDVRPECLREAHNELYEHDLCHKLPFLKLGKFDDLCIKSKFHYIWAFSVLFHMDDDTLDKCFQFVSERLRDDGVFYANVNIGEENGEDWQGFPVIFRTYNDYIRAAFLNGLLCEKVGRLKAIGHISGNEEGDNQLMLTFKKLV